MDYIEKLIEFDGILFDSLLKNIDKIPNRIKKFLANYYPDARIRKLYWQYCGIKMGENTYANLGLKIVPNDNKICVSIGANVSIAPNVLFVCKSSANNGKEINEIPYVREILTKSGDIIVEDEVWIGASVTILPGVKIGRCSVIGAGSVVINDVDPYSIYFGIPAKKIRDLKTGKRI